MCSQQADPAEVLARAEQENYKYARNLSLALAFFFCLNPSFPSLPTTLPPLPLALTVSQRGARRLQAFFFCLMLVTGLGLEEMRCEQTV